MFPHLPVCICHICIRHKFLDLPLPFQLYPGHGYRHSTPVPGGNFSLIASDHLIILLHHIGLDRHPVNWCFFQHTHVTDSDQAHMKRSGNRCCRKCQNINIFPSAFDLSLCCTPKRCSSSMIRSPRSLNAHPYSIPGGFR